MATGFRCLKELALTVYILEAGPGFPNTDLTNQISLNYIARPQLTRQLGTLLTGKVELQQGPIIVLLHGHAGFGKTQLVRDYARTQVRNGVAFRWLDASNLGTLRTSLLSFSREARLSSGESRSDSAEQISAHPSSQGEIKKALRFIGNLRQEWLLVYDNYDVPTDETFDLRSYFPGGQYGHIIVTSRNRGIATDIGASCLPVESLDALQSIELLRKSAKVADLNADPPTRVLEREIAVELLGCHPLAIAQAGAYICNRIVPRTLQLEERLLRFKKRFVAHEAEMLGGDRASLVKEYGQSVITSWDLSFRTILEQNRTAAQLLLFLGFMHHANIPQQIFATAHESLQNLARDDGLTIDEEPFAWLQAILASDESNQWDSTVLEDCLGLLESYSLIQVTSGPSYIIHPLVHTWTRVGKTITSEDLEARARLALVLLSYVYENDRDWASPKTVAIHMKFINHLESSIRFTLKHTKLLEFQTVPKLRANCLTKLARLLNGQSLNLGLKTRQLLTHLGVLAIFNGSQLNGLNHLPTLEGFVWVLNALGNYGQYADIVREIAQLLMNFTPLSASEEEGASSAEINLTFLIVRDLALGETAKPLACSVAQADAAAWADSHRYEIPRSYYLSKKVISMVSIYSISLDPQEGLRRLKSFLPEVEEELGIDCHWKWLIQTGIAWCLFKLGRQVEAASLFQLVLRTCKTLPGDMRKVMIVATHGLNEIFLKEKAYSQLLDNFRILKERLLQELGPFHGETLLATNHELSWECLLLHGNCSLKFPGIFPLTERSPGLDEQIILGLENALSYKALDKNDEILILWDGLIEHAKLSPKPEALIQDFTHALKAAADAGYRQGYYYIASHLGESAETLIVRASEGRAQESKVVQLERLRRLWDRLVALHEAANRSDFQNSIQTGDEVYARIKNAPFSAQPAMIWLATHYIMWLFQLQINTKVSPITYRILGHFQRLACIHFGPQNVKTYRIMGSLALCYRLSEKPAPALRIEDHLIKRRIQEGVDHLPESRAGNTQSEKAVATLSLEWLVIEYKRRGWYSETVRIFEIIIESFIEQLGVEAEETMVYIRFVFVLYGRLDLDGRIDDMLKAIFKVFQDANDLKKRMIVDKVNSVAAWCFEAEQFAAAHRVLCWLLAYGLLNLASKISILGVLEIVAGKLGRNDLAKNYAEAKAELSRSGARREHEPGPEV